MTVETSSPGFSPDNAYWAEPDLQRFGAICGSAEVMEWGFQANDNKPVLHTHNRQGERVDEVRFHQLMALAMQASTLIQSADPVVAEAFCVSRLAPENRGQLYATLPAAINCQALIERATPRLD